MTLSVRCPDRQDVAEKSSIGPVRVLPTLSRMSEIQHAVAPDTTTAQFSLTSLFGVRGKIALITGGGSGLGSYAALALALNGAKVYIVGRRKEKLQEVVDNFNKRKGEADAPADASEGIIVALPGDVSSKEGIAEIVEAYGRHEQYLNILVNNAGILRKVDPVDKDDGQAVLKSLWDEEWSNYSDSFSVNVIGVHFCAIGFAPFLDRAPKPSLTEPGALVLNVASIAGMHINRSQPISYQTSKDAAIKLSTILAGRFIPLKIRVNVIAPGPYPSLMTEAAQSSSFDDPQHPMYEAIRSNPIKRSGTVDDFAGLILFLCSRAGAYLNGTTLVTDGGRLLVQSAA